MESWKTLKVLSVRSRIITIISGCLQTEGLVSLSSALTAVEEVGLDIVQDGEPGAACCVGSGVLAVGASDATSDSTYFIGMICLQRWLESGGHVPWLT